MKLEAVTAELRPRTPWESVDLGLVLVRRDFWRVSGAWWLGMAPVLLLGLPLWFMNPAIFCLLFLWWLPVASRMELFVLSRRLFGEAPGWRLLVRELPRAIGRRFFYRMVWARFSPWRPLTMPVEDLEGLRGKDYRVRCRVLMMRGEAILSSLTLWRYLLAGWLVLALMGTLMLLLPGAVRAGWSETLSLWAEQAWVPAPAGLAAALPLSVMGSLFLVDLYATGAGFGFYVNQRTWNEGWDVELAFRRMGGRLRGILSLALVGFALLGERGFGQREPQEVIDHVLADPDFTVHWDVERTPVPWDWDFGGAGGSLGEELRTALVVLSLVGLAALLGWLLWRNRHLLAGTGDRPVRTPRRPARVVMGMDVRPESLPGDVGGEARRLWGEGRGREAMALLYRGAVSWMVGRGGVAISESDTEGDCLRKVRQDGSEHLDYFERLTEAWQVLAYAGRQPGAELVDELCGGWPFREGGAE